MPRTSTPHLLPKACSSISNSYALVAISTKDAKAGQMPWPLSRTKQTDSRVSHNILRECKRVPLWYQSRSKRHLLSLRVHSPSWALQTNYLSTKTETYKLWAKRLHHSKTENGSTHQISTTRATWGIRQDRTRNLGRKCSPNFHMTRFGSDRKRNLNRVKLL